MKYVFYTIAFLALAVSTLCFLKVALSYPYIALPVSAIVCGLFAFLAIRFRSQPPKDDENKKPKRPNSNSTNHIAVKKHEYLPDKTGIPPKFTSKEKQSGKKKQSTDKADNSKDFSHTQSPNSKDGYPYYIKCDYRHGRIWLCHSGICECRIKPCGDALSEILQNFWDGVIGLSFPSVFLALYAI